MIAESAEPSRAAAPPGSCVAAALGLYGALMGAAVGAVLAPLDRLARWRRRARPDDLAERLGRGSAPAATGGGRRILLHAVSVGEMRAAAALAHALLGLQPGVELIVTAGNRDGRAAAERLLSDCPAVRAVQLLPWDRPAAMRAWLARLRPDAAAVVEAEIWPGFFGACRQLGIPLAVVSGRLTGANVRGYRLARPVFARVLAGAAWIGVQEPLDRQRFLAIGARPGAVHVLGDLKAGAPAALAAVAAPAAVILPAPPHPQDAPAGPFLLDSVSPAGGPMARLDALGAGRSPGGPPPPASPSAPGTPAPAAGPCPDPAARLGTFARLDAPVAGPFSAAGPPPASPATPGAPAPTAGPCPDLAGRLGAFACLDAPDAGTSPAAWGGLWIAGSIAVPRPLLVAGSTHAPEERWLIAALVRLVRPERPPRQAMSLPRYAAESRALRDQPRLVLAPRSIGRAAAVARLARRRGLRCRMWSDWPGGDDWDVLVLDQLGPLAALYPGAALAFVGGTLARCGGHSPLEAAACGVPLLAGPHREHIAGLAARLELAGGLQTVSGPRQLAAAWQSLLADLPRRHRMRSALLAATRDGRDVAARYARALLAGGPGIADAAAAAPAVGAANAAASSRRP
jgi:3-deoxy-D-manno-octulosonic-acid transferase